MMKQSVKYSSDDDRIVKKFSPLRERLVRSNDSASKRRGSPGYGGGDMEAT